MLGDEHYYQEVESGNNINTDMNIVNKTLVIIIHELKGTVYKNVLFCSDTIQIMVFIYTEMKLNIKMQFYYSNDISNDVSVFSLCRFLCNV